MRGFSMVYNTVMDLLERQQQAIVKSIEMLESNYEKLGRPPFDHNSATFWKFLEILVDYWHVAYPMEVLEWHDTRQWDLATESTLGEQAKKGLHKSYAFPAGLFNLIKAYWRNAELTNKEFGMKFKQKFPFFRNSNYT